MTKKCFMFHEIVDDEPSTGFHIRTEGKYSINVVTFERLLLKYKDRATYTFDDGGCSNLIAADILERHGLSGIFFVISEKVGKEGFMSKDDLVALSRKHIVASHSRNHVMGPQNRQDTYFDWFESIELMRELNCETDIIALPGGYMDRNIYLALKKLGVSTVYHSAPLSFLLYLFYPGFTYRSRKIVTAQMDYLNSTMNGIKSLIKQLWNIF